MSLQGVVAGEIKTEGDILARISVRTLIVKEWKPTFWIITGGKMLLYRSKEDYLYVSFQCAMHVVEPNLQLTMTPPGHHDRIPSA
jgi:hypothetical protein